MENSTISLFCWLWPAFLPPPPTGVSCDHMTRGFPSVAQPWIGWRSRPILSCTRKLHVESSLKPDLRIDHLWLSQWLIRWSITFQSTHWCRTSAFGRSWSAWLWTSISAICKVSSWFWFMSPHSHQNHCRTKKVQSPASYLRIFTQIWGMMVSNHQKMFVGLPPPVSTLPIHLFSSDHVGKQFPRTAAAFTCLICYQHAVVHLSNFPEQNRNACLG